MSEESKNAPAELEDEAVEQATGGSRTYDVVCPSCHYAYTYTVSGGQGAPPCPKCGYVRF